MAFKQGLMSICALFNLRAEVVQVIAIMMDNASNNDMRMDVIEAHCCDAGIEFSAMQSRMHCMPHMVHLACIKVHSNSTLFMNLSSLKLNPSSFSKVVA